MYRENSNLPAYEYIIYSLISFPGYPLAGQVTRLLNAVNGQADYIFTGCTCSKVYFLEIWLACFNQLICLSIFSVMFYIVLFDY